MSRHRSRFWRTAPRPGNGYHVPVRRLLVLVLLASPAACGDVTREGPLPASDSNPLDAEEGTLLFSVNDLRLQAGVAPVTECVSLNTAASVHSDDMRDRVYLSDTSPDGTTARTRLCDAGYQPACDNVALAELVGSGLEGGAATLGQWQTTKSEILLSPGLKVAGIGRSLGGDVPRWTLDLAGEDHTSCK